MASPSHKSSRSMSVTAAQQGPNGSFTQRKLTSQSTTSLALPEKVSPSGRPPSPLRNEFLPNTFTGVDHDGGRSEDGSDDEDDDNRWMRSPSPTSSSVSQFAANFTSRLGNWMSPARPAFNSLPTDAELEAEAERERERSRREAERILTEEAAGRRALEDRLLETTRMLPPPPIRSQTMPNPGPPSPASSSQKDGIWSAVKNKLTPTKDPLTPAQQVVQDAKAREKKSGKGKDKEWPAKGHNKFNDPAFLSLNNPPVTPPRRPLSSPNVSPTPSRPTTTIPPPNLSPTPGRGSGEHRVDSLMTSPATTHNSTPVYAQFDAQGTLDVHGTLLTIARRFEKLEKWTVGHVRALEERMSDVERWLVDKEKEKDEDTHPHGDNSRDIADIRDELGEVQSRVGELGREMAKIVTAPGNLSNGPSRGSAEITTPLVPQTTSSIAPLIPQMTNSSQNTPLHPRYQSQHATISPPLGSSRPSSSRLPYPTGDYASPPSTMMSLPSESFSPPVSPPRSRPGSVTRNSSGGGRSSISGLPATTGNIPSMHSVATASSGYSNGGSGGNNTSGSANANGGAGGGSAATSTGLPAPASSSVSRPASVSPAPVSPTPASPTPMARKRYTVALGGPLVAPPDEEQQTLGRAYFSASPGGLDGTEYDDEDEDEGEDQQETIGKRASARVVGATYAHGHGHSHSQSISGTASLEASPGDRRARAQSTYGFPGALQTPTRPLVPRSKSTDRGSLDRAFSSNSANSSSSTNGFVDPYRRRQETLKEERLAQPKPLAHGKVPIGQLVAFFDKDKKR